MKKIFIIILISCCFCLLSAQDNTHMSGYVIYQAYFPSKKFPPPLNYRTVYFNNIESLQVSNKTDKANGEVEKSDEAMILNLPYGDSLGRQIYRNLKDSLIVTRRPKNVISDAFIVEENWVQINWEIKKSTKKIGNYTATKAKGHFRGRDYTVWFTYDIPVPFGPWKLYGLPGLILEVEDSDRMMRFYAEKIIIPYNTQTIIKMPRAKKKISHEKEVYMSDNFDKLLVEKMNARQAKGNGFATTIENNDGRNYKPEKIFEWELKSKNEKKN